MTDLNEIASQIEAIDGVTSAEVWDRVEGKERVYFMVSCHNGSKAHLRSGYGKCHIDLNTGEIAVGDCAGAATRKWHDANKTFEQIAQIIG